MMWIFVVFLSTLGFILGYILGSDEKIKSIKKNYKTVGAYWLSIFIGLLIFTYITMPIMNFWNVLLFNVIILMIGYFLGDRERDRRRVSNDVKKWRNNAAIVVTVILIGGAVLYAGAWMNSYHVKYSVASDVFSPVEEVDVSNYSGHVKITIVPYETAQRRMGVALSKYGTIYKLADADYQIINSTIYWVGSIAFDGVMRQWKYDDAGISVVAMMSAEENENARLVKLKCPAKYVLGNYFGLNVERVIWKEYPEMKHSVPVLQIHDGKAYYVSMLMKYDGLSFVPRPWKLAVVDACTGDIHLYGLDDVPDWITFTHQEDEVEELAYWWGVYRHGFWNTHIGHKDVMYPTGNIDVNLENKKVTMSGSDVWMVLIDGEPYWFTAYRPPGSDASKNTMIGMALINARTGKMTWVSTPDYYNDYAIMENALQSPEISKSASLMPAQPYPIFMNGSMAWFMTIIGSNNELQFYAIGDAKTGQIFIGKSPEVEIAEWVKFVTGVDVVDVIKPPTGNESSVMYWVIIDRGNGTVERVPVYKGDKVEIVQG